MASFVPTTVDVNAIKSDIRAAVINQKANVRMGSRDTCSASRGGGAIAGY